MSPRITVLLPTHNGVETIGPAIRSVIDQTSRDFELIVVGDGCTDGTGAAVAAFDDDRIRWLDYPKGPYFGYSNRNTALRGARGELIAYMGHDDLMFPDHLERLAAAFDDPNVLWAYSRPLWLDDAGRVFPVFADIRSPVALRYFLQVTSFVPAVCVMHRRGCLASVGGFAEDMEAGGDWDLWKRIIRAAGAGCIGFERRPTTLRFRANWRDADAWDRQSSRFFQTLKGSPRAWPPRLTLATDAGGRPPQQQILERMEAESMGFVRSLREGVAELQDDVAWRGVLPVPSSQHAPTRPTAS